VGDSRVVRVSDTELATVSEAAGVTPSFADRVLTAALELGVVVPSPEQQALFAEPRTKAAPKTTWLTPYGEDWEKALGGTFPYKIAAKALKPLVDKWGGDTVRLHLRTYLVMHRGPRAQFCSIVKFAQTFGQWEPGTQIQGQRGHEESLAADYERRQSAKRDDRRPSQGAGSPPRRQLVGPKVEPGEV